MSRFLLSLLFMTAVASAEDSRSHRVEESLEQKVQQLALVQFGTPEVVSVHVVAKMKAAVQPITASDDLSYAPLPPMELLKSEDQVDSIEVALIISSLVTESAARQFQDGVRRMLASYKPRMTMRRVTYTDVKKPTAKTESTPLPSQSSGDGLAARDYLYAGTAGASILTIALVLLAGLWIVSRALQGSAQTVMQGLQSMRASGSLGAKAKEAERSEEEKDRKLTDATFLNQTLQYALSVLKSACQDDPLKLVSCLTSSSEDVAGLRWLLSQLSNEQREQFRNFLGAERIKALSQLKTLPTNFNVVRWAQDLTEKLSLRKLDERALIELALKPTEISRLFQMAPKEVLEYAVKMKDAATWKVALEVLTPEILTRNQALLSAKDWSFVLASQTVTVDGFRTAYSRMSSEVGAKGTMNIGSAAESDEQFEMKVLSPLLETLRSQKIGKDLEFIDTLKQTQPGIVNSLRTRFWTFADLRRLDPRGLKNFLAAQSNETLYAMLLVAPENDQHALLDLLPEGMKKTVVIDLLAKGQAKGDPTESENALRLTRQTFDRLIEANAAGRLALKQGAA